MEKIKRDEYGYVPESVNEIISRQIERFINKGVHNKKLNDIILHAQIDSISPYITFKHFLDYCEENFNVKEFFYDWYEEDVSVAESEYAYPDNDTNVENIMHQYIRKQLNLLSYIACAIENDKTNNIAELKKFEGEIDTVSSPTFDENYGTKERFKFYLEEIEMLEERNDDLNDCLEHINVLLQNDTSDFNDDLANFKKNELHPYISNKLRKTHIMNAKSCYDLFSIIIDNLGWKNVASEGLKYEIMQELISFASKKGIQLDFNTLQRMSDESVIGESNHTLIKQ